MSSPVDQIKAPINKHMDEFEIKTEDLIKNSSIKINAICDGCGELSNIRYSEYLKQVHADGTTYCHKCAAKFGGKKLREILLNKKEDNSLHDVLLLLIRPSPP